MKSREEILGKAKALENFSKDSAQTEARYILLDIAGDSEADMFSEAGVYDYLHSLEFNEVTIAAGALVVAFLFDS